MNRSTFSRAARSNARWLLLALVLAAPAAFAQDAERVGAPEPTVGPSDPNAPLWVNRVNVVGFDNGPLVTHPGGGPGGADASALQTAIGLNIFGFGHSLPSGNRVADDFVVPAGGWMIESITFFAYQTGSTTTSTINHVNLRIWDGPPGAMGSNIVFGDTTTNRLASSTFTNIYRVQDTALTGNTRPIMANVATVGTTLPAGTYWVDWQTGGTLASGPWAMPVSILGQTAKPGANALQFLASSMAWGPLVDSGTAAAVQDLPFIVNLVDQPSISLAATVGTTPGVCAATSEITVTVGTTVYYCYTVTNTGNVTLNLHDLSVSGLGSIFTGFNFALTPGSSVNTVTAGLSIPSVANATATNTATWTAYNAGPTNTATAQSSTTVNVLSPANVSGTKTVGGTYFVGSSVTYTIVLSNSGAGAQGDNPGDEFTDVLPASLTATNATASSGTIARTGNTVTWNGSIAAGGSVTITITATINASAAGAVVNNQGSISFDANGDGTNDTQRLTDDPGAAGEANPTGFVARLVPPAFIPTLSQWSLLALIGIFGLLAFVGIRRQGA